MNLESADFLAEEERFHYARTGRPCSLPPYRFAEAAIEERNQQFREALRELQTLLIDYQWRPTVESPLYSSLGLRLLWDRARSEHTDENRAVAYLLEQIDAQNGQAKILRFRRCRECGKWFYVLKDQQSYCSESCRKRYASHSVEFKEKRATYIKQYRIDEAEREARAKRLAKGKGK